MNFGKITIVGGGFMGSSLALECLKNRKIAHVSLYARRYDCATLPKKLQVLTDILTKDLAKALDTSELVIFATPAKAIVSIYQNMIKVADANKIICTDLASTKANLLAAMASIETKNMPFVGSHPICGSEKAGMVNAKHNLYRAKKCVVCTDNVNLEAKAKVAEFWLTLGMKVIFLKAAEHDKILAQTSHLPHALATCMTNFVFENEKNFAFAGSGIRDATRIAAANATLWTDIFLENSEATFTALNKFEKYLLKFKNSLKKKDTEELKSFLEKAALKRERLQ